MMSAARGTPALELNGITAGYERTTVLRDVAVTVPPRAIVAVLGPNGAGKTTLLRVAAGLLAPRVGTVHLDGCDVTRRAAHRRARGGLCLMPEGRGIFRSLTVSENLVMYTPPWIQQERVERALDAFPILRDRLKSVAGTLSGGQQQMLALARIYVAEPRVVLFDEVSMGLAPLIVAEIFDAITQLARSGISIVLVEQYVNRALQMADHAYMISRGRITFSGRPSELDEQTVLNGYLGTDLGAG
jgi:branched-chain amino acid transport system ATP-binding protein